MQAMHAIKKTLDPLNIMNRECCSHVRVFGTAASVPPPWRATLLHWPLNRAVPTRDVLTTPAAAAGKLGSDPAGFAAAARIDEQL